MPNTILSKIDHTGIEFHRLLYLGERIAQVLVRYVRRDRFTYFSHLYVNTYGFHFRVIFLCLSPAVISVCVEPILTLGVKKKKKEIYLAYMIDG